MILVHISIEQRKALSTLQEVLADQFMSFAYNEENFAGVFPDLGEDYSPAYGYAQEHHTVEIWLRLWTEHTKDVIMNGTPASCRRLLDLPTSLWNKLMGNVDTVRKVVKKTKAIRGPNSGPGSLMWYTVFDYIFYNAFRIYQYARLESKMGEITTVKQLHREKQKVTFRSFLFKLSDPDCFGEMVMQKYFPGLREHIDRHQVATGNRVSGAGNDGASVATDSGPSVEPLIPMYKIIGHYLDPSHALFKKRMNKELQHVSMQSNNLKTGTGNRIRRERLRCVLCCYKCAASENHVSHSREGRTTTKFCFECKVALCKHCFKCFHQRKQPPLPPCSPYNYVPTGIGTRARQGSTEMTGLVAVASRRRSRPPQQNDDGNSKKDKLEDDELEDEESKDEESIPGSEEAETVIEQRRTRARSEIETTTEIETRTRRSRRKIVPV